MYGRYYELKKKELEEVKSQLKELKEGTPAHAYAKERIDYLLHDLFEIENRLSSN